MDKYEQTFGLDGPYEPTVSYQTISCTVPNRQQNAKKTSTLKKKKPAKPAVEPVAKKPKIVSPVVDKLPPPPPVPQVVPVAPRMPTLYGNVKSNTLVWNYLLHKNYRNGRPILLISGPPGVGKSTAITAMLGCLGYKTRVINASDERNISTVVSEELAEVYAYRTSTVCRKSATSRLPTAFVLEEFDGSLNGTIQPLYDLVKDPKVRAASSTPIICIANELDSPNMRGMVKHMFVEHIRYYRLSPDDLTKYAGSVLYQRYYGSGCMPRAPMSRETLRSLAAMSNGDMRHLERDLDFWSRSDTGPVDAGTIRAARSRGIDITADLFGLARVVMAPHATASLSLEDICRLYDSDDTTLEAMVYDNFASLYICGNPAGGAYFKTACQKLRIPPASPKVTKDFKHLLAMTAVTRELSDLHATPWTASGASNAHSLVRRIWIVNPSKLSSRDASLSFPKFTKPPPLKSMPASKPLMEFVLLKWLSVHHDDILKCTSVSDELATSLLRFAESYNYIEFFDTIVTALEPQPPGGSKKRKVRSATMPSWFIAMVEDHRFKFSQKK